MRDDEGTGSGNTAIAGTLEVTGATALNGGLTMDTKKFTVADTTGNTAIAGTLDVTGAATLSSTATVPGTLLTTAGGLEDLGGSRVLGPEPSPEVPLTR